MDKVALQNWGLVRAVAAQGKMTDGMARAVMRGWRGLPPPPNPIATPVRKAWRGLNDAALRNAGPLAAGTELISNYGDDALRATSGLRSGLAEAVHTGAQHALSVLGL